MEEKEKALKKIDKASEFFGLDSSKRTVFEISQGEDNEKKLTLKNGSWSDEEPWFGIDENNEVHTMISIKSLANLIAATKNAMQENFNLKLSARFCSIRRWISATRGSCAWTRSEG